MSINAKESPVVLLGDVLFFFLALWLTLFVRYFEIPSASLLYNHIVPFSILFVAWIVIYFMAGLYDRHTVLFKKKLPDLILNTQALNVVVAAVFFFSVPYFKITPKTNLVLYLAVSFWLVFLWRAHLYPRLFNRRVRSAILLGAESKERSELEQEIRGNAKYGLSIDYVGVMDSSSLALLADQFVDRDPVVIADWAHGTPGAGARISQTFPQDHLVDMAALYEDIFQRTPLSLVSSADISHYAETAVFSHAFGILKRSIDVVASFIFGLLSLTLYPFVIAAIKYDDGGPAFIVQNRVGLLGRLIRVVKFRSMSVAERERITKVGGFLRRTRLDELPQLWNVFTGDLSLVGPRPELPDLVSLYEQEIPHYNVRHVVKPGLSGWAQIREYDVPRGGVADVIRTEAKLSYDIYYIKNRSLLLDMHIMLKTFKTLMSRSGS